MIVPENVVKQWYRKEHPIYRSFAYLFCNEWWSKPVPSGFSVCPYFWLAVIVSPTLRLLILLSRFVFAPIARWMGIAWLDKKAAKLLVRPGAGTGAGLSAATVFALLGVIIYFNLRLLAEQCFLGYLNLRGLLLEADMSLAPLNLLYYLVTGTFVVVAVAVYERKKRSRDTRPYIWAWGVACASLIGYFARPELTRAMSAIGDALIATATWILDVCAATVDWLWAGDVLLYAGGALAVWTVLGALLYFFLRPRGCELSPEEILLATTQSKWQAAFEKLLVWLSHLIEKQLRYAMNYPTTLAAKMARELVSAKRHDIDAVIDIVVDEDMRNFGGNYNPEDINRWLQTIKKMYDSTNTPVPAAINSLSDWMIGMEMLVGVPNYEPVKRAQSKLAKRLAAIISPPFLATLWTLKQFYVLACYAWLLVRAGKSRACPYISFESVASDKGAAASADPAKPAGGDDEGLSPVPGSIEDV